MGSKKHKKESKKKKHRSRSRSPLEGEERQRKRHHKKHKDRKKERSPDVEEVPVDSHLQQSTDNGAQAQRSRSRSTSSELPPAPSPPPPPPPIIADRERERDRERRHKHRDREEAEHSYDRERERERERSPPSQSGGAQESLSVEDTNRLRAKLGLKPLEQAAPPAEDGKINDDLGEFYHKPAANIAQQKKTDKIKERLEERREKRKIEKKLQVPTLGEGSDDEDAMAWVKKSREVDKQRQEATKRAALLDEMEEAFGVGALLRADEDEQRARSYSAAHLRGLRVAHDLDAIGEERETILTLADKHVLADDAQDELVNVNMVDDERYRKKVEEAKKARVGYQAYDDEADLQAAALGYQRPVLAKYDEEIDKSAGRNKGFVIGDEAALEASRFRDMMRAADGGPARRLESLQLPAPRLASNYLSPDELPAKFKKPRRRGKIRKKAKEEPIDVDDYDAGVGPLVTDDTAVMPELLPGLAVDDEEVEPDSELQLALARARRVRQARTLAQMAESASLKEEPEGVKKEEEGEWEAQGEGAMVLDATAEFCRTLGDIPTYGLAGNRDRAQEILDFEREMELEAEAGAGAGAGVGEAAAGAWSRVDIHNEKPPDLVAGSSVGLEAEPALGAGVAGALQLALSKGYLERAGAAPQPRAACSQLLAARHYSIEDKSYGEDDKYGRRERGHGGGGPLVDFREKPGFRPNIKLEYVDDDGRALCPKEAFRYLSHKFHGKGPGKNKQEKRLKKQVQEGLMKKMSSTDTPLGTLQLLQDKQRETHSAYIVLSGNKRDGNT